MSQLGDEKKAFKITGKYTGGVDSHGVWTDKAGPRFGNDWEAEELAMHSTPRPSMAKRLQATEESGLQTGRADYADTVKIPEPTSLSARVKEQVKEKIKAKDVKSKTKTLLNKHATSESKRLEGLFTTHKK